MSTTLIERDKFIDLLFEECKKLIKEKSPEYSPDEQDFTDFLRDCGEFENRTALDFSFSLMLKHIVVLKAVKKNPKSFALSKVRDRVLDSINYLVIFLITYMEEVKRNDPKLSL